MIKIKNLSISYGKTLLDRTSIIIENNTMVAVTGTSGSGKSSLLYMLGLISNLGQAEYIFDNIDISNFSDKEKSDFRKKNIGFIFQDNNLIESLNVKQNVEFCSRLAQSELNETEIMNLLEYVGLATSIEKMPSNLSGGEKQRLAVACALAKNPSLILADEPTSSLDNENSEIIISLLKKIAYDKGAMVIVVTHNYEIAMSMDKVYKIEDEQLKCIKNNIVPEAEIRPLNIAKKIKIPFSFYKEYSKKIIRGKVLQRIILIICSVAITLSVFSFFFGSGTVKQQQEYMNKISKNQIFVVNQSFPSASSVDTAEYLSISYTEKEHLSQISEIEEIYPFISFASGGFEISQQSEITSANIAYSTENGKEQTVAFSSSNDEKEKQSYSVLPYYKEQTISNLTEWKDSSASEESIYISYQLAKVLGIENINHSIELNLTINIPVFQYTTDMQLNGGSTYPIDIYIYKQITLPVKVDGIFRNDITNTLDETGDNNIYMPIDSMLKIIDETKTSLGNYHTSTYYSSEVSFSSYMLFAKDFNDITRIIEKVKVINPNFIAVSEYQDIKTMQSSIETLQKVLLAFSMAFLLVVVLLISLVFVHSIYSRRTEVALLKANGLSTTEIIVMNLFSILRNIMFVILFSIMLSIVSCHIINGLFGIELLSYSKEYIFAILLLSAIILSIPTIITTFIIAHFDPSEILRN